MLCSGVAVLLIITAALLFLTSPVQLVIQKAISSKIPGTLGWDELEISMRHPGLTIRGFHLKDNEANSLLQIRSLELDIDFFYLFKKEFVFTNIWIDSPQASLSVEQTGALNIVSAMVHPEDTSAEKKKKPTELPFNIRIESMTMENAGMEMQIPHKKIKIIGTRIDMKVDHADIMKKSGAFKLTLNDTIIKAGQVDAKVDARLSLEGPLDHPLLTCSVSSDSAKAFGHIIEKINVGVKLQDGMLNLSPGIVVSDTGTLNLFARVDVEKAFPQGFLTSSPDLGKIAYSADMDVKNAQIHSFLPDTNPARGQLNSGIHIKGKGIDPKAMNMDFSMQAAIDSLTSPFFSKPEKLSFTAGGGIKNNMVSISGLEAGTAGMALNSSGTYHMDTTMFNSRLFLKSDDIRTIAGMVGFPAAGRLSVSADVKGTIEDPKGYFNIEGENIRIRDVDIQAVEMKSLLADGNIHIKNIQIDPAPGAQIHGSGVIIPRDKRFKLDLESKSFPLSAISGLKTQGQNVQGQGVPGLENAKLDLTLHGQGKFDNPQVQSRIIVKDIVVQDQHLPVFDVNLDLNNRVLAARGNLGGKFQGTYELDRKFFDATLEMQALELAPYFKMAGQDDLSGRLNGTISASGSAEDLKTAGARMDLSDLVLRFRQKEAVRAKTVRLSLNKGVLTLKDTKLQLFEKGTATIRGRGESTENMMLDIDADIPLTVIDPVVEQIDQAQGRLTMSAAVSGNLNNPDISGQVRCSNIGMSISHMDQPLRQINGVIHFDREKFQIDQLKGFLGQGDFLVNGLVALTGRNIKDADLILQAHSLPLDLPDLMELKIDSNLVLSGNPDKSTLSGDIVLQEGRYYKDVKLDLAQIGQQKRASQPDVTKKATILDHMALDINLIRQEPFLVENNLATLSISPDLHILGTAGSPLVNGRAQVDEGVIRFQKKEFDVKKGVIDFVSPYRIEPVIDMEAVADVRSWTIFLTISGPPENLNFKFRSEPVEEHADIVSLLAFGKTTRELRSAQGGSNSTPAQILAGFVAETMQENLKEATGMDYVDIGVSSDAENDTPGTNVTIGKDLSRQLTVKYGADMRSGETVQKITTDYKILENLLMSGYQDSGGDFGGGLKYRLEFR